MTSTPPTTTTEPGTGGASPAATAPAPAPATTEATPTTMTPHPSWLTGTTATDSHARARAVATSPTQSTLIATTTSSRNKRKKQKPAGISKVQVDIKQVDSEWPERIEQLQLYKGQYGTCEVVQSRQPALYNWTLQVQRILQEDIKGALLKPDQANQLIDLGFGGNQTKWELMFAKLKAYFAEHGDCKVPVRYTVDKKLGKWVSRQRDGHNARFLTQERRERLNQIGFSWKISSKRETLVGDDAQLLPPPPSPKATKRAKPRRKGSSSNDVVYHPRGSASSSGRNTNSSSSNKTKASMDQKTKDDEIIEWEYQFQKLKAFQKKHGHTCLPRPYTQDPGLGLWVQTQCSLLQVNKLKAERKKRLKSIDFDFWQHLRTKKNQKPQQVVPPKTALSPEEEWNVQFHKLVHFKAKYGHTHVDKEEDGELWAWVRDQRSLWYIKHLPHEHEIKLTEIGFSFTSFGAAAAAAAKKKNGGGDNNDNGAQLVDKAREERKNAVMAAAAAISQTDDVVAEAVLAAKSLPPLTVQQQQLQQQQYHHQQQQQQQQKPPGLHALAAAITLGNMNGIGTTPPPTTTLGNMSSHYDSQGNYVRNPLLLSSYYNSNNTRAGNFTQNQAVPSMVTATPQYSLPSQMRQVTPPLNMVAPSGIMTGLPNGLQITPSAATGTGFAANSNNSINNSNAASPPTTHLARTATPDQVARRHTEENDSRLDEFETPVRRNGAHPSDDILQKKPSGDDGATAAALPSLEDGGNPKRRQLERRSSSASPSSPLTTTTTTPKQSRHNKTEIPGSANSTTSQTSCPLKKRKLIDDEEGRSFAAACYALAHKLKRPRKQQ